MARLLDLVFLTSEGSLVPAYWFSARCGGPTTHQFDQTSCGDMRPEELKPMCADRHLQLHLTGKLCA